MNLKPKTIHAAKKVLVTKGDRDVVEDIIEGGIALEEVEDEDEDEDEDDENENEDTETVYDPLSGWKNDPINPVLPKFIHYSGPNLPFNFPVDTATPLDYFSLFFDQYLISKICEFTNEYAVKRKPIKRSQPFQTSPASIKILLGSLIYMGIFRLRKTSDYFREDPFFNNYLQTRTSREILEENARYLYVSDPKDAQTEEEKRDPLYKIRFLVENLEKKFKQFWQPYPSLTVDEAMVPTKSKLSGFRMYMKEKPHQMGL